MNYVQNETYIPSDDMAKIRARLINKITEMSDADIRTAAKSEASFRAFVNDLFRSIAQVFGYVVGQVVGLGREVIQAVGSGWNAGWKAGLG
jgi:hypothetical protein